MTALTVGLNRLPFQNISKIVTQKNEDLPRDLQYRTAHKVCAIASDVFAVLCPLWLLVRLSAFGIQKAIGRIAVSGAYSSELREEAEISRQDLRERAPQRLVSIRTEDGETLEGRKFHRQKIADGQTLVAFAPNRQIAENYLNNMLEQFPAQFSTIYVIDSRGVGTSSGSPTPLGVLHDAFAVLKHVHETEDVALNQLTIYGHCLGGSMASAMAAFSLEVYGESPKELIMDRSFANTRKYCKGWLGKRFASFAQGILRSTGWELNSLDYIRRASTQGLNHLTVVTHMDDGQIGKGAKLAETMKSPFLSYEPHSDVTSLDGMIHSTPVRFCTLRNPPSVSSFDNYEGNKLWRKYTEHSHLRPWDRETETQEILAEIEGD
jgi:hypothetical protein